MPTLPDLGMNGLINSVRRLSGLTNPGYRAVNSSAEFIAGMAATLDSSGELIVANNTTTKVIGLFYNHKTTSFYRPVIDEKVTFGTSPNSATVGYLKHANLKGAAGTNVVVRSAINGGGTVYDYAASGNDYRVSYTNGTITTSTGSSIGSTDTVYVSYMYEDPNLVGIDQTLGAGLCATLEDSGEIATLAYDAKYAYAVNADVYINSAGYLTSATGSKIIGFVTKSPTADSPELCFKMTL